MALSAGKREQMVERGLSPARRIPGDPEIDDPRPGRALCLSGGGFRAMLFHAGALWRMNQLGLLARLERIGSVSGGSICAGALAVSWERLGFDPGGIALRFEEELVALVRRIARANIDVEAVVLGLTSPGSISSMVSDVYQKHFDRMTLQDLPDEPQFVFCATNLQTGVLFRFSKTRLADYRIGELLSPRVEVATAVAASSAFPPFLSPFVLKLDDGELEPTETAEVFDEGYRKRVVLCDGGVYDNLGLDAVWKRYETIFVSDAGGILADRTDVPRDWARQFVRVVGTIDNQVRGLRKRQVISSLATGIRTGAYWSIQSHVSDYELEDALPCPPSLTRRLAQTPTRLTRFDERLQERLINWGYAVCDTAIRKHVITTAPPPDGFPYPAAGLG